MSFTRRVPWWGKMAAKVVLSRVPAGYRAWERAGLFVHGAMDQPEYAWRVFTNHIARAGWQDVRGRIVVELGPGDSLATAIIARALGAEGSWLVDAGAFARTDPAVYVRLVRFLEDKGLTPPPLVGTMSVEAMLEACRSRYLTTGAQGLAEIPAHSVHLVFSQAVLEHVRLREFASLIAHIRRILGPGGVSSHQVDLKDHLAASLNNLRFSERFWESEFIARSGFYTNRLRRRAIVDSFAREGFEIRVEGIRRWPELPLPRRALAPIFRDEPDDELRISQFDIVARLRQP